MNKTLISALSSSGTADRYDRGTVRLCDVNPVACQVNTDTDNYLAVIVLIHEQSSVYTMSVRSEVSLPRPDTVSPRPLRAPT